MKQKCVNLSVTKAENHINYYQKELILNDHINYYQKELILNDDDNDHRIIRIKYDLHFDGWYVNANFLRLSTYLCFP